jgi:hypothetical protein
MKFIKANKPHRKSGGMGHPSLCEGTKGLTTLQRGVTRILELGSQANWSRFMPSL